MNEKAYLQRLLDIYNNVFDSTNNVLKTSATVGTVTVDTEFPAAAALADGTANPTTTNIEAMLGTFNGTTWDRGRSVANAQDSTGTGIQASGLLAQFDNVAPSAVTENQFAPLRMSAQRALNVVMRDNAGNERGLNIDASGNLTANIAGTVTVDTELPAAAALADATANPTTSIEASAQEVFNGTTWDRMRGVANGQDSTGTGIAAAGILGQLDDVSTGAVTENQFAPVRISTRRAMLVEGVASGTALPASQSGTWTVQPGNTANTTAWKVDGSAVTQPVSISGNQAVNVAQINGVTPLMGNGVTGTGSQRVTIASDNTAFSVNATDTGNVAHAATDSGNPVKVGGRAINAEITAVSNGQRTDAVYDLVGKQIVLPYANPENFVSGVISTAMTGTTSTSLIAAPAAGLRNYITSITVSNSHATVGTDILIQDGSAGTTLWVIPAASAYGGATITFPTPLRQPTTATGIFAQNVTTGSNTKVSANGYKGA